MPSPPLGAGVLDAGSVCRGARHGQSAARPERPLHGTPRQTPALPGRLATAHGEKETRPVTFRVWAPTARQVEVVLDGGRVAMSAGEGGCQEGWWSAEVPGVGPGRDYAFAVDGGPPLPDPRSPWQPHGVHGPSRRRRPRRLRAGPTPAGSAPPLPPALVYELHVGTFTPAGTFDGAIERLDHLVELGVTHVELMPVAEFPGASRLGLRRRRPLRAASRLRRARGARSASSTPATAAGLAVLLDVVYNHLGPAGNYLARVRPVLHRPLPRRRGAAPSTSTARTATRCAASSATTP